MKAQGFKYSGKTNVFLSLSFFHIGSIGTLLVRPWSTSGIILGSLGRPKIFHGAHCGSSWGCFGDLVAPPRSYVLLLPTTSNCVRTQTRFWNHFGDMLFNPRLCWNHFTHILKLLGSSWSHLRLHFVEIWKTLCNLLRLESVRSSWSHLGSIVIEFVEVETICVKLCINCE